MVTSILLECLPDVRDRIDCRTHRMDLDHSRLLDGDEDAQTDLEDILEGLDPVLLLRFSVYNERVRDKHLQHVDLASILPIIYCRTLSPVVFDPVCVRIIRSFRPPKGRFAPVHPATNSGTGNTGIEPPSIYPAHAVAVILRKRRVSVSRARTRVENGRDGHEASGGETSAGHESDDDRQRKDRSDCRSH
jgi:hypothetical protein